MARKAEAVVIEPEVLDPEEVTEDANLPVVQSEFTRNNDMLREAVVSASVEDGNVTQELVERLASLVAAKKKALSHVKEQERAFKRYWGPKIGVKDWAGD